MSIIHNYRGFLLDQLGEVARSASTTSVSNAAEASGSADLVANSKMLKGVVNFAKFEDNTYSDIINQLTNHANSMQQGSVEGGIFMSHGSGKSISNWLERRKRECILLETFHSYESETAARPFAIGEIGFNAGHSALNALLAREGIQVISFDLGEYWDSYSKHSYQLLSNNFPNQLTLVMGDSTDTVPHFIRERPDQKCNILFVDGGHTKDVAAADIANMAPLANHTFHRLIVDDADWGPVREAWDEAVAGGMVKETGVVASNYCSAYDMLYATDATFGLEVPILSPSEDSGPANPDILSPTGAMRLGEYAV